MIYPGKKVFTSANCSECGKMATNTLDAASAFISICCQNPECEVLGRQVIIERATMAIINIVPPVYYAYSKDGPVVAVPVLVDRKGRQLFPEPQTSSRGSGEPCGKIYYHSYEDRNSLADNSCAKCGFLKEDPVHAPV